MPHFLENKNIYLREVRVSDVNQTYYNWLNDPKINQYLETRFVPRSQENIKVFVEAKDGEVNEILLAICDKITDQHIGNIKLGPINWIHRYADISLFIGEKSFQGKGIGTQSISLVTQFGFKVLNLHKLRAGCYEHNKNSIKAFKKNGFVEEGRLAKQWFAEGEYMDQILLGLLNEPSL